MHPSRPVVLVFALIGFWSFGGSDVPASCGDDTYFFFSIRQTIHEVDENRFSIFFGPETEAEFFSASNVHEFQDISDDFRSRY